MAVIQDNFEHARIPLKPLPYTLKELAQCNELIIDYSGEDATYHIYIASENDSAELIDITQLIINEILPNAKINANQFQIILEGLPQSVSLKDIINEIYSKYLFPEEFSNTNLLFGNNVNNTLLKDANDNIYLPITSINNVYDNNGVSLAQRLLGQTRIAFSMTSIRTQSNNQTSFDFEYPFKNYSEFIDVRIGSVYIDKTRYSIVNNLDQNNDYTTATLTFIDGTELERGRKVDIIFMFDSIVSPSDNYNINGADIINKSVSIDKLVKVSDSYTVNDPTSIASSAALYKLFDLIAFVHDNNDIYWSIDNSNNDYINCTIDKEIYNGAIITITLINQKTDLSKIVINNDIAETSVEYNLYYINDSITSTISAGKTIRIVVDKTDNKAYLVSEDIYALYKSRIVHTCIDEETIISYNGLDYNALSIINVYRNGVRLFEDIDYYIDKNNENITLFVRTNEGERIIFESITS